MNLQLGKMESDLDYLIRWQFEEIINHRFVTSKKEIMDSLDEAIANAMLIKSDLDEMEKET